MGALRIGAVIAGGLAVLAVGTYIAGEQTEIALLRTFDEGGTPHDTKLWVVDIDGTPWVRVARPERAWLARLRAHPEVVLIREGVEARYRATPSDDPLDRARVDTAFRHKYGWVDAWYGLLVRSDPIAVALRSPPS